jgi:predicted AAA+ superfamily ATPase
MYTRILEKPLQKANSFFLFGPRGTGKTTWLKQNCPHALHFDLLSGDVYTELLARPERFGSLIPKGQEDWIILDEVQRVPNLLNEVHRLIETSGYRFILTGSSARTLRRGGVNLLAGRAHTYHMYPLVAEELGGDFSLEKSLLRGHLPQAYCEEDARDYLASYVQTYLREEVLQEGLTRNLTAFSRFLEIASFSQADVLNISEAAREVGLQRKTVSNFFDLLEDLLLAFRLPIFARRAKRRLSVHPKFYFFDVGVYRQLRPRGPLDSIEEIAGAAVESLVLQELRAISEYKDFGYTFFYWRTAANVEVDIVAYGPLGLIAIEVKRSARISKKNVAGLNLFKKDYPMARCFLFYGGNRREYWGEVEVWPLAEAIPSAEEILRPYSS